MAAANGFWRSKSKIYLAIVCDTKAAMTIAQELYKLYPKHEAKRAAITAIEKAMSRLKCELFEEGIEAPDRMEWIKNRVILYAQARQGQDRDFTPHPATWFNQSRYLDDEEGWFKSGKDRRTKSRAAESYEAIERAFASFDEKA